jgi:polyisoprenoid-binding protein YceI
MKNVIVIVLLFFGIASSAQNKYITKIGSVTFEASVPSFEEVKATNTSTTAILNTENGEFAALVFIKGFRFKNALMEEHFNENYAESNTYPKATFKGVVTNFSPEIFSSTSEETYMINGILEFHGVSKSIQDVKINAINTGRSLKMNGTFTVLVSDFNIEIPKIVSNKLSNEVAVTFDFELLQK